MKKNSLIARLALLPIRVAVYAALVFAVLMGVIYFTVFRDRINDNTLPGILSVFHLSNRARASSDILIDSNPANQYGMYANRLAVLSPERLVLYNGAGAESASAVIRMENPKLRTAGNTAAAFDRGGKTCIIAGEKGVEAAYDTDTVITVDLTEKGCYAIATEKSGYNGAVSVYDASHYKFFEWYSSESGYVQDIALNKDASLLAVVSDRQENESFLSRLTLLRTDREDPLAAIDIPDRLIYSLRFMSRDHLCVVLEDEIRFYAANGELIGIYYLEGRYYLDAQISDGLCAVLTGRQASAYHSMLALLNRAGELIGEIALEETPVDSISVAGSYAGVLQNGTLSLYNAKGALCFAQEDLTQCKKFFAAPDGAALMVAQDRAFWIE